MDENDVEQLLPEDDSVFLALVDESLDMSGGALLEDSFSSMPELSNLAAPDVTSTPLGKGQNTASPSRSTRSRRAADASPARSTRSRQAADASPARSTRSRQAATPPTDASPARSTRSQRAAASTTDASPARSTRSRQAATPPTDASPARSTRSQRAAAPTTDASPAGSGRSRRATTPTINSSPATSTRSRSQASPHCDPPERPSSPATGTRSRTRPSSPAPSTSQPSVAPRIGSSSTRRPPLSGVRARPAPNVSSGESQAARIKCRECPNTYANEQTFQVHKKWHAMKRAFNRIAKPDDFLEKLPNLIVNTLNRLLREKYVGKWAEGVRQLVSEIKSTFSNLEEDHDLLFKFLHEHLYSLLVDHTSVFPSNISYTYHVGVNCLLNNLEFKNELKKHLVALGDVQTPSMEVINIFIGNFMLILSSEVIVHFVRTIHGATCNDEIRRKRSEDNIDSTTFLQLIYHIGGSVISGLLFKGNKYRGDNEKWSVFVNILNDKFHVRDEGASNECASEVSEYTKSLDRGKLIHPTQEALDFFIVLFDLFMSLEGNDGSLPNDVIDNYVLKDNTVLILWDVLVGNVMDNETSLSFLMKTCETCKLIVMKGIINRLLNEHIKKPFSAVPLRSKLAN